MPPKKSATTAKPPIRTIPISKADSGKTPIAKKKANISSEPHAKTSSKAPVETDAVRLKHKLDDDEEPAANSTKRAKSNKAAAKPLRATIAAKKPKIQKAKAVLNLAPTQRLNIYVFGGNSAGELGLGSQERSGNVDEPLLNKNLIGTVQIATGGMHGAALTHDNKILTWGGNDLGALGRDTTWDGGLVDMDNDDDSDAELNPREATPTIIDTSSIPPGTVFTQVAASDSATFALTNRGFVYGWGTMRSNDGTLGFSPSQGVQRQPARIPALKEVTKLAAGSNHALALTSNGSVFAWGWGPQSQLGRRMVERTRINGLTPREFGLRNGFVDIGSGADHSFAIHKDGTVYSWGLNSYGQTGIIGNAGENEAFTQNPTVVESLKGHGKITCITGGNHHSIAVTDKGECLVWGRVDGYASGLEIDKLPSKDIIRDHRGKPRILTVPTRVPELNASFAAAGSDHCIAITRDGKAFSWGFNVDHQTGHATEDDVERAQLIDNDVIRRERLVWAGAGGQYSMIAGERAPEVNGGH